jgi:hypothetical protein
MCADLFFPDLRKGLRLFLFLLDIDRIPIIQTVSFILRKEA